MIKKTVLLIILIFTLNITAYSIDKWGYAYHKSKFTNRYLKKTIPNYDVISLTGFYLKENGNIAYRINHNSKMVLNIARKYNLKIYPLLSFPSWKKGSKFLNSEKIYSNALKNISELLIVNSFHGVHLDFEYLPEKDSIKLGRFLKRLKNHFKNSEILKSKKISMALFPVVDFPAKLHKFHNYKIISKYIDEAVIMCYDYHRPGTAPGPVTDINWAEKNIRYSLKFFNSKNIWLGIPAYGYRWNGKKATAISARYGKRVSKRYKTIRDKSGNLYFKYTSSGKNFQVFLSDKTTRNRLRDLAGKYNLKGSAMWRLKFED